VAEQLEFVLASSRVIRHVRPKLASTCCDVIVQAPAPSRSIERGIVGPGLLPHALVAQFGYHPPLYRETVIHARAPMKSMRRSIRSTSISNCTPSGRDCRRPTSSVRAPPPEYRSTAC
jgi:transposase